MTKIKKIYVLQTKQVQGETWGGEVLGVYDDINIAIEQFEDVSVNSTNGIELKIVELNKIIDLEIIGKEMQKSISNYRTSY